MTISPHGMWLVVRGRLGQVRRTVRRVRRMARVAGQPSEIAPPPSDPRRGRALFWKAVILQKLQRTSEAADTYRRAIAADGRFAEWHYRLGNVLRYLDRWDEAITAYESALELESRRARAHFWLAVSRNQPDSASHAAARTPTHMSRRLRDAAAVDRAIERAMSSGALEARHHFWLGVSSQYWGRLADAESQYVRATTLEPGNASWFRELASVRRQLGDFEGAVDAYEAVVRLLSDPDVHPDLVAIRESREPHHALADAYESALTLRGDDTAWQGDLREGRLGLENWAAVAALYRAVLESKSSDPRYRFWLGVTLAHLGDWAEAADSYRKALEDDDTNPVWNDFLAIALAKLEDWNGVLEASLRALSVEPSGERYFRLAVAHQRLGQWEASSRAFEEAISLEGWTHTWARQLGAIRREMHDWAGAAALYRTAISREDDPRYHFWLGFVQEQLEDWAGAAASFRAAIDAEPANAGWHFRLGHVQERYGPAAVRVDPRLGLVSSTSSNLPAALRSYEHSLELDPADTRVWIRLANVREQMGDLDGARAAFERATELDPTQAQSWYRLGRVVASIANRRGAYHPDEHDELERLWGRAIELNPGHSGARQQLARSSVKAGRWQIASATSWYPTPSHGPGGAFAALRGYLETDETPASIRDLDEVLDRPYDDLRSVPLEWWFALHWRLLSEGRFTSGYRAKAMMANRIVETKLGGPDDNLSRFIEIARALTFLDRVDDAIDHVDPRRHPEASAGAVLAMQKMRADLMLLEGHVDAHAALIELNRGTNTSEAEERFDELIVGKRVAIVGPADTAAHQGEEIDGFDVVIRTKYQRSGLVGHEQSAGSRTDLSYYALSSAVFERADIVDALATGDLQMAVFRTATFRDDMRFLHHPGDVRFIPSEYQGSFRAAQFAIQRIAYDVLRFRPAVVKVFNINFFVEEQAYRDGYVVDYSQRWEQPGLTRVLPAFGHDHLADFVFTQRLRRHGLIEVDDHVGELLKMTDREYLAALDRRGRHEFHPPGGASSNLNGDGNGR